MSTVSNFEDCSDSYDKESGGERHIRRLSHSFWISVLHRRTGFGRMEWETAICQVKKGGDPANYDDRTCDIVLGDHRKVLNSLNKEQVLEWYSQNSGNKSSFDMLMDEVKKVIK